MQSTTEERTSTGLIIEPGMMQGQVLIGVDGMEVLYFSQLGNFAVTASSYTWTHGAAPWDPLACDKIIIDVGFPPLVP